MTQQHMRIEGTVRDVFAHRFTLLTGEGLVLADLTPDGIVKIALAQGDTVIVEGERKPSEIKVSQLTRGDLTIQVEPKSKPARSHDKPGHHHEKDADPAVALAAVRRAGFAIAGEPLRKPKHFEILGMKAGEASEIHVAFDGKIRHAKRVDPADPKWAKALEPKVA